MHATNDQIVELFLNIAAGRILRDELIDIFTQWLNAHNEYLEHTITRKHFHIKAESIFTQGGSNGNSNI